MKDKSKSDFLKGIFPSSLLEKYCILDFGYTEDPLVSRVSWEQFEKWSHLNWNASLEYMKEEKANLRRDLRFFFPEFSSAFVFLFSYESIKRFLLSLKKSGGTNELDVASYAYMFGDNDYHRVIPLALEELGLSLKTLYPSYEHKFSFSVDLHPVLERDLAYKAGLGWFGKNTLLISTKWGSYTLLGSLLWNHKLEKKKTFEGNMLESDHCGICRKCVDLCPTLAITEGRHVISQRCLSFFTIEDKTEESFPPIFDQGNLDWKDSPEIFGCDICQDVCPWNSKEKQRIPLSIKKQQLEWILTSEWFYLFVLSSKEVIVTFLEKISNRNFLKKSFLTVFSRPRRKKILAIIKSKVEF